MTILKWALAWYLTGLGTAVLVAIDAGELLLSDIPYIITFGLFGPVGLIVLAYTKIYKVVNWIESNDRVLWRRRK